MELTHKSVLLAEAVEALCVRPDGIYLDGTLGGGGHAVEIARRLETGLLLGVDRDAFAIDMASRVLSPFFDKVRIVQAEFSQIEYILAQGQISCADGVLLDLGVSSFQLDDGGRGFSYNYDAALDMRMDKSCEISAYDVVNNYSEADLAKIFWDFGEERWARRISEFVVKKRASEPIETTFGLVDIIKAAIPRAARTDGPHPAKRVFQAIRIEVNNELGMLEQALENFVKILNPGGRICVITFHSLEDRLVKNVFRRLASACICPREIPICVCKKTPEVEIITKKPVLPSADELNLNHRARSAKLRVAQKIK